MDMDLLAAKVSDLAGFVWNGLLLYLLVGTGLIFTIRTRFIQVRKFGTGFRRLFGSVNLNGALYVTVTRTGDDTTLARIIRFVEDAQGRKAPISKVADRVAGVFVPVVMVIAAVSAAAGTRKQSSPAPVRSGRRRSRCSALCSPTRRSTRPVCSSSGLRQRMTERMTKICSTVRSCSPGCIINF